MADTFFEHRKTPITADWLNDVNDAVYKTTIVDVMSHIPKSQWAAIKSGTSVFDSTSAIQQAIDTAHAAGGGTVLFPAGLFNISGSITAKSYVKLSGVYGEDDTFGVVGHKGGTELRWNGGASTLPLLRVFSTRLFELDGIHLDGAGFNTTGILLDSDNNPSGSQNEFRRFSIRRCLTGVQWGTSGISGGAYANDGTRFSTFTIWSQVVGSKGFVVNSGNAGQMSVIESGGIQVEDIGIDLVVSNLLQIRRVFGGGVMNTAFIRSSVAIDLLIEGCASEAWGTGRTWRTDGPSFLLVVPPVETYPMLESTTTLIQNQINNPIRVQTSARITSIGDAWGYCQVYALSPAWVSGAVYSTPTVVSYNNQNYALLINHTAGASFETDLAAGRWAIYFVPAKGECSVGTSYVLALNNGANTAVIVPATNEPLIGWQESAFVRLSNFDPGRGWVSPPYGGGNFTASGSMTWTVESGDVATYAYTLLNRTMTVSFTLNSTSVGGTPSSVLRIKIPLGKFSTKAMNSFVRASDNGTPVPAWCYTDVSGVWLNIQKTDFSNWSLSTNGTTIQGQITFEID